MPYAIGDLVWYVIPSGVLHLPPVYAAAVVVNVRPSRVGILTVLSERPRYVCARRLSSGPPPPDAAILASRTYGKFPREITSLPAGYPPPPAAGKMGRIIRAEIPGDFPPRACHVEHEPKAPDVLAAPPGGWAQNGK